MLEILYNTTSLVVKAWCGDEDQFGNFDPGPGQAVVIYPIDPPGFESDWYKLDMVNQTIVGNPDYEPTDYHARVRALLATSPENITMPEMWELLRIYARLLGVQ